MSEVVESLTFEDYTDGAIQTDLGTVIRDSPDLPITYPILGYANELGELKEKGLRPGNRPELLGPEFGDVCWYFFVAMRRLRVNPDWAILNVLNDPDCTTPDENGKYSRCSDYFDGEDVYVDFRSLAEQVDPIGDIDVLDIGKMVDQNYYLLEADIFTSKALGILKKIHRGDSGPGRPDREKLKGIGLNLAASFVYVVAYVVDAGVNIEAAALDNLTELKGRVDRGTLQGDGDKR